MSSIKRIESVTEEGRRANMKFNKCVMLLLMLSLMNVALGMVEEEGGPPPAPDIKEMDKMPSKKIETIKEIKKKNDSDSKPTTGVPKPLFTADDKLAFDVSLFAEDTEAKEFKEKVVDAIPLVWGSILTNEKSPYVKKYLVDKDEFMKVVDSVKKILEEYKKMDPKSKDGQQKLKEAKTLFKGVLPKDDQGKKKLEDEFKKIAPKKTVIVETKKDQKEEDIADFKEKSQEFLKNFDNPLQRAIIFKSIKLLSEKIVNDYKEKVYDISDLIVNGKPKEDKEEWRTQINKMFPTGSKQSSDKKTPPPLPGKPLQKPSTSSDFDMTPLAQALDNIIGE